MKQSFFRLCQLRRPAFTLVELLVVIAIIAILAAVTLNVGSTIIKMAKRTKAANTATQIQTAVLGYYTEYSVYPVPSTTAGDYYISDASSSATTWQTLTCILCGNVHPSSPATAFVTSGISMTNSRGIAFLTMKASDVDANDCPLNPLPTVVSGVTNYYGFNIAINSSYSGVLGNQQPSNVMPEFTPTFNAATGGTSTAGVAVWANCNNSTTLTNANFYVRTY